MKLESLRAELLKANLDLVRKGLVVDTFGNVSGVSREQGLVVIKPSGVPYESLQPGNMVVTDLAGKVVEGDLRPSAIVRRLTVRNWIPAKCPRSW